MFFSHFFVIFSMQVFCRTETYSHSLKLSTKANCNQCWPRSVWMNPNPVRYLAPTNSSHSGIRFQRWTVSKGWAKSNVKHSALSGQLWSNSTPGGRAIAMVISELSYNTVLLWEQTALLGNRVIKRPNCTYLKFSCKPTRSEVMEIMEMATSRQIHKI